MLNNVSFDVGSGKIVADIPVLALFVELDMNVDWHDIQSLYERVFGADVLSVNTFPSCNHNLFQAHTGSYYEFVNQKLPWKRCDGFLSVTKQWLEALDNN